MVAPTHQARQQPLAEDLQQLYNQVWASYTEDPPPVPEKNSRIAITDVKSASIASPVSVSSQTTSDGSPAIARDGTRPLPTVKDPSPPTRTIPRPLPKPPQVTSAPAVPMAHDQYRIPDLTAPPPHLTHTNSDMPSSRRLPVSPDGVYRASTAPNRGNSRRSGLPHDPRPHHTVHASRPEGQHSEAIPFAPPRPAGASAPDIPGHDHRFEKPDDEFAGRLYDNGQTSHANGTPQFLPNLHPSVPNSRAGPPSFRDSSEEIRAPNLPTVLPNHLPTASQSIYAEYQKSASLGRTVSDSSGASSYGTGSVNRPVGSSRPSDTSNHFLSEPSFATSIDQGSSRRPGSSGRGDYIGVQDVYHPEASGSFQAILETSPKGRRSNELERTVAAVAAAKGKAPQELQLHQETEQDEDDEWDDVDDPDDTRFVNFSLLSHIAVRLRDKVPRGTHVKGSIPYPRAFTGKDIVSTIQTQIQRELLINHGVSTNDRRAALQVARSLQSQLFFYEVEWGARVLQDGVEDVYMFLDDQDGVHDAPREREELPTGVITMLTKCYASSCGDGAPCYSYSCPRRQQGTAFLGPASGTSNEPEIGSRPEWSETVEPGIISSLPESEINRQTIIHKLINKEEQYVQDLNTVESRFIQPLRKANPPVIQQQNLEQFIEDVFGNILDLRECNRRLLEVLYVRQREQAPVIQRIGDVFLGAATEFRLAYPIYIGHLPLAEKRMKDEIDANPEFRIFIEQCSRQNARSQDSPRLDLKHFLNRPSEHLQKYPVLMEAILNETADGNPDADYLTEAVQAIRNLQSVAQLRTFQTAMGRGLTSRWEWADLVSPELKKSLPKKEAKRQAIMFELIKGEMAYVKDLESLDAIFARPLRLMEPPVIARDRLDSFIQDVFHNVNELYAHHRRLVERFHEIQREEHPTIRSLTAAVFDAALNFRDSYLEYIPNYPIAKYRIDNELATNPAFKEFHDQCVRHPDAHRFDIKHFINRPIPRLLRYELLMQSILKETPEDHEDQESIPHVLDLINSVGKETEPGVLSSAQKVELWRYHSHLVFKPGESTDMDLLNEHRSLIHTAKVLRQPETGFEWNGWSELFVLLFDNYLVMTKPRDTKEGVTKYHVHRRPVPLDLLTLANFNDPPTQRGTGILRGLRGGEKHGETGAPLPAPENAGDARSVYPFTFHHSGRTGGLYTLYAESTQARAEWKQKLEEAIGLRKVVQESNKVFEVETLSADTFLIPSVVGGASSPSWSLENSYTGKVTCSVPFTTADGRGLVAIGCAEGVWIGFRHDPRSMRRVLHLKMVTQCAMLQDFGIFLVLADKSLFAYHIEALVPSSPQNAQASQTPQKLNGTKDVHFFSVGCLGGRTLVIYMKKKGLDSVFRVLEPVVVGKVNERTRAQSSFGSRLGLRAQKSEWFRLYRDFFLPGDAYNLIFLKARIAVLCTKGFEIMDLTDYKSSTVPRFTDPRLEKLAKRCENCRPMGMFRSREDEFLLCYNEFGLYVDKHGELSRSNEIIEWEGTVEQVAVHHPYILLFDSRFIEIRHVETGRLAQIIPGHDVRCLWNKPADTFIAPSGNPIEPVAQDARVHGVMTPPDSVMQPGPGRTTRTVAQHVFELIPTVPLYIPEKITSPSSQAYFPQSSSPPHSPRLAPSASWRS